MKKIYIAAVVLAVAFFASCGGSKEAKTEEPQVEAIDSIVEEVVEEAEPEYTGPTADDLRREAEEFKKNWEIEKQNMLADAQAKADEIVKKAEDAAFAEVKRQTDQAQIVRTDAETARLSI